MPDHSLVLVLSGTLPGEPGVGGVILQDLAQSTFGDALKCACIPTRQAFEQNWMSRCPIECTADQRKYETGWKPFRGVAGEYIGYHVRKTLFGKYCRNLVNQVLQRYQGSGIRRVWAVLDCPTVIETADRIARALDVPLSVMVWDAPELLADQLSFDPWSRRSMLDRFREVILNADRVGVISEQMQVAYTHRFGDLKYVIMRHGLDESLTHNVTIGRSSNVLRIGFAGSITAQQSFQQMVRMLDDVAWNIGDRPITLRLIGSRYLLDSRSPQAIEYFGWRSSAETVRLLSECDVLYLPQPFEPHLRELAELSFPTKLSTYLASGKPILLHTPDYGSIVPVYKRFPFGEWCNSLDTASLLMALENLCNSDAATLEKCIRNARDEEFRREVFLSRFEQLTGPYRNSSLTHQVSMSAACAIGDTV